jgi:hypothetical protein
MNLQTGRKAVPTLGELMDRRNLTLDEVHVLSQGKVDAATVSRTARGLTTPRPSTVVALARAFGISAKTMRKVIEATVAARLSEEEE